MPLKVGEWIDGRYRIIRQLGQGSEGSVYLAVKESIYKFYAVKVLEKEGKCFSKEGIELWKRLSHPGLPEIVDIIEETDEVCLVMEYVEGSTLSEVLDLQGIPAVRKVVVWGIRICEILEYLHGQNPPVIFGDLKPSNLVLQKERIVLVDLGSAVMRCSKGMRTGTADYFPPWRRDMGDVPDVDTDIYGLGKTLGFLASGGGDFGHVPKELRKILNRCTRQSSGRYQTVKECRLALEKLRNRGWFLSAMVLLALCIVSAAGQTLRLEDAAAKSVLQYEELLVQAKESARGERREILREVIQMQPAREDGYLELIALFLEDASLSGEEDICLRTILKEKNGEGICNEEQLRKNKTGYAQVAYEMGMAYWYFFKEENSKSYAAGWFKKVLEVPQGGSIDTRKLLRCRIYEKIGSYREKLIQSNKTGDRAVSYKEYWQDMMELFAIPTKELDNAVTTLYFWKELLLQMSHYTFELKEDGVLKKEMEEVINRIRNGVEQIEEEGQAVMEQKEKIGKILETLTDTIERMDWEDTE